MLIDCGRCIARLVACGDCVVTALLASPSDGQFTAEEVAAVDVLASSGLVSPLRYVRAV
jgi:hypothetical protein